MLFGGCLFVSIFANFSRFYWPNAHSASVFLHIVCAKQLKFSSSFVESDDDVPWLKFRPPALQWAWYIKVSYSCLVYFNVHSLLFSSGSAPENSRTSIFQTPAMQNLMQQVSANPDMFQNMMQSPYMQEMMQQMLQNPDLMASVSHFFYSWIIKSIFYRRVVFFMAPSLNRAYDDKFQHTSCGSSFAKGMFHFWLW